MRPRRTPLGVSTVLAVLLLAASAGCTPSTTAALPAAAVTTSSANPDDARTAALAVDGSVETEWTAPGGPGAWIQLTWPTAQPLGTVVLHDRPEPRSSITGGTLTFDDGSAVQVGALPDNGAALLVRFTPRGSASVRFTVTSVAAGTTSIGLAELAVDPTTTTRTTAIPATSTPPDVPCPDGSVLDVVAHPDDDLFFISPHIEQRLADGVCLRTVVVTSGDDGLDVSYWRSREEGLRAAYAMIAGVPNAWTTTRVNLDGYFVDVDVLAADPRVSVVFLRLPEGNLLGQGFPATGEVALSKLWSGQITAMTSLDGSLTVTSDQLDRLLRRLISLTDPTEINTLDPRPGVIDHNDHQYVARYAIQAAGKVKGAPRLTSYEGYGISTRPSNVFGADLAAKTAAFFTYTPFDKKICQSPAACGSAPDGTWLSRQYVVPR